LHSALLSFFDRQSLLAGQHVLIRKPGERDAGSGAGANAPGFAVQIAAFQAPDDTENIQRSMRRGETKNLLGAKPTAVGGQWPPLGFSAAPARVQKTQSAVEPCQILRVIFDSNVHIPGQFRQVAKQEVHAADEQEVHLLVTERPENLIYIHSAQGTPAIRANRIAVGPGYGAYRNPRRIQPPIRGSQLKCSEEHCPNGLAATNKVPPTTGKGEGHGWLMRGWFAWNQDVVSRSGRRVADRDRRVACATQGIPFMSQPWAMGEITRQHYDDGVPPPELTSASTGKASAFAEATARQVRLRP
jgi:hypothetical protein